MEAGSLYTLSAKVGGGSLKLWMCLAAIVSQVGPVCTPQTSCTALRVGTVDGMPTAVDLSGTQVARWDGEVGVWVGRGPFEGPIVGSEGHASSCSFRSRKEVKAAFKNQKEARAAAKKAREVAKREVAKELKLEEKWPETLRAWDGTIAAKKKAAEKMKQRLKEREDELRETEALLAASDRETWDKMKRRLTEREDELRETEALLAASDRETWNKARKWSEGMIKKEKVRVARQTATEASSPLRDAWDKAAEWAEAKRKSEMADQKVREAEAEKTKGEAERRERQQGQKAAAGQKTPGCKDELATLKRVIDTKRVQYELAKLRVPASADAWRNYLFHLRLELYLLTQRLEALACAPPDAFRQLMRGVSTS